MSYDIKKQIETGTPATFDRVRADLGILGLDRGALVRRQTEKFAAVAVLLLSKEAINEIGPFLTAEIRKLPGGDQPWTRFDYRTNESLGSAFNFADDEGLEFLWMQLDGCLVVIFRGPAVTDEFAARLTKLNCPCQL